MRKIAIVILVMLLATAIALAANDPGHDVLYIEQDGDSELTGNLNITNDLKIEGNTSVPGLWIYGDGYIPATDTSFITAEAGGTGALYFSTTDNLYLKSKGGDQVTVGTSSLVTDFNVTGALYVGGAATISSASTIGGSPICTVANGLCTGAGSSEAGGWSNTSTVTSTDLDVNIGSGAFYVNTTNNYTGIGLTKPTASLEIRGDYEQIFRFSDDGVDHGMTGVVPTNVFFSAEETSDNEGGIQFRGLTDTDGSPMVFVGISGAASPTEATVKFWGGKKSGTDYGALAASEKVVEFSNYGTSLITVLGDGKTGIGIETPSKKLEVSDGTKGITFDPVQASPTINTTSGNLTLDSASGYVIINLG